MRTKSQLRSAWFYSLASIEVVAFVGLLAFFGFQEGVVIFLVALAVVVVPLLVFSLAKGARVGLTEAQRSRRHR